MKMYIEGTLPFGTMEALGVAEGGVGLAENQWFDAVATADIKAALETAKADLLAGKITVDTVFK